MKKVKIIFNSLIELWDFKQVLPKSVLQTMCMKRSLTCLCSEAEIELAIHAYHAKVEEIK